MSKSTPKAQGYNFFSGFEATVTPAQCRAARALLGWSQEVLSEVSLVAKATIANFEKVNRIPYARTLYDIQASLQEGGVEIMGPEQQGVRFTKGLTGPKVQVVDSHIMVAGKSIGRKRAGAEAEAKGNLYLMRIIDVISSKIEQ